MLGTKKKNITDFFLSGVLSDKQLSFRHHLERSFSLTVLFQKHKFYSELPYIIRKHLWFSFLCFVLKIGLAYAISIVNWTFGTFFFFFSFYTYRYLRMFHDKTVVKISEYLKSEFVRKLASKLTTHRLLNNLQLFFFFFFFFCCCFFCFVFLMRKMAILDFFKTN